jgi:hypothetical protein
MPNESVWLEERWALTASHRQSGNRSMFPDWYYDEVTDRQLKRLGELGIKPNRKITKGQASDLIGMNEPAEDESFAILDFFKQPTKGMNQTRARHEVALLFQDQKNAEVWEQRPPSQQQKEFFKFFGIKVEKGITAVQASKLISEFESELAEREDPKLDEWEALEAVIEELSDPVVRADYEINKPSRSLIKSALDELKKEGKSFRESADSIGLVAEKLIELKPDLQLKTR